MTKQQRALVAQVLDDPEQFDVRPYRRPLPDGMLVTVDAPVSRFNGKIGQVVDTSPVSGTVRVQLTDGRVLAFGRDELR